MDHHHASPLLGWANNYYCQGKSMEELRNCLLYTTMELESTKLAVQEELKKRDYELNELKLLLKMASRERDEAQQKCQRLLSGNSTVEGEPRRGIDSNNGFSSSDCEESIVSSPVNDPIAGKAPATMEELAAEKPLPEKGKLLQAVMRAGPLLQTLLLAGPLPQWRHPPPTLESFEIPPVAILSPPPQQSLNLVNGSSNCGRVNGKRVFVCEGSESAAAETKFQRVF